MKKSSLQSLLSYLNGTPIDNIAEIAEEIQAELSRNAAKAASNRELYDAAREAVMAVLDAAPATVGEIFDAAADTLPEGFSKGKLSYALSHGLWEGVVKIDGNPNTYRRA